MTVGLAFTQLPEALIESVRGHLVRSAQNDPRSERPPGTRLPQRARRLGNAQGPYERRGRGGPTVRPGIKGALAGGSGRWLEPDLDRAQPAPTIRMFFEGCWLTLAVDLYPSNEADYETTMKCFYQLLSLCRDR